MPVFDGDVCVLSVEQAAGVVEMTCERPPAFAGARPGQFLLVASNAGGAPLLGRPISILSVEPLLRFAFAVVGEGTAALARVRPGEAVHVTGPLGHAFDALPDDALIVVDASHFGTLLALAQERHAKGQPLRTLFVARAREAAAGAGVTAGEQDDRVATLFRCVAPVTVVAQAGLAAALAATAPQAIAAGACDAVMAEVQRLAAAADIPGQVALQAPMACGLGACLVCVRRLRSGADMLVCKGPLAPLQSPVFA